ncbi:hypothetical protein WOLCODRAFT_143320 [Wolfiporia cocos MD-104 SS10]|uniref:Thioredoxin-like fold domain-containing protein n=1 Tax=Wolfiporia cocos (strain MD-104) TaxID=742152 RepID=A0A2H3JT22_WOLCO|nr:hypothetical protein WOLCODRAFT_143320 [Wolfiporia cocos MD-104 SS10]
MALQPSLCPLIIAGSPRPPHTLVIFHTSPSFDYVCLYSAKIAFVIDSVLVPLLSAGGPYNGKVKVILLPQAQPWHLFKQQGEYFNIPTSTQTPLQIRANLKALAAETIGVGPADEFAELLTLRSSPNGALTSQTTSIKFARQNGIHVSPTVLLGGLAQNDISSSWGEEWTEYLSKKVTVRTHRQSYCTRCVAVRSQPKSPYCTDACHANSVSVLER